MMYIWALLGSFFDDFPIFCGMAFLLHRFRAAKLPEPDRYPLKEATKRIQEAYAAATSNCTS